MSSSANGRAKGGRPATGSIVRADPETKTKPIGVRVTKANGKRRVVPFHLGTTRDDAIALAPIMAECASNAVDEADGMTVARYVERWCEWREARGLRCVEDDRTRLAHVLPTIGHLPVTTICRDDLKALVMLLDAKVRRGFTLTEDGKRRPFAWKTARCVWDRPCRVPLRARRQAPRPLRPRRQPGGWCGTPRRRPEEGQDVPLAERVPCARVLRARAAALAASVRARPPPAALGAGAEARGRVLSCVSAAAGEPASRPEEASEGFGFSFGFRRCQAHATSGKQGEWGGPSEIRTRTPLSGPRVLSPLRLPFRQGASAFSLPRGLRGVHRVAEPPGRVGSSRGRRWAATSTSTSTSTSTFPRFH